MSTDHSRNPSNQQDSTEISGPCDTELMKSFCHGDLAAMEHLIRRHGNGLLGFLIRMTGNQAQAEDLFQETFLRVQQKATSFTGKGSFKSWLFSIAAHTAIDQARQRQKMKLISTDDPESGMPLESLADTNTLSPAEAVLQKDQAAQVHQALNTLPPRQRATVVLAYYDALSYPEVAGVLGCSLGTVKTQMFRALATLSKILPRSLSPRTRGGAS